MDFLPPIKFQLQAQLATFKAGLPQSLKILEIPGIRDKIFTPWKVLESAKKSLISKYNKNKLFVKNNIFDKTAL